MKHLLLVRHAKSSWDDPARRDVDRPLNERGLRNAPEMAARIRAHGPLPQLIVSSHARRALHTAQLIADGLDIPRADIDIVDALYEASPQTLLAAIRALPPRVGTVLLVAHNPGLTELAAQLCPAARIDNIPTCGVVYLDFAARAWTALGGEPATAWDFDYPKRKA